MSTTDQVRDKAQEGAQQAKGRVREQVDQRSTQAGEQLTSQAGDVKTLAEELRNQGKEGPAKVAEQAAGHVEKLGGYLQDSDADRILSDVEDYARQNPWAVAAGGLALGFLASRFVKASTDKRLAASNGGSPTPRPAIPPTTTASTTGATPGTTVSGPGGTGTSEAGRGGEAGLLPGGPTPAVPTAHPTSPV